MCTVIKTKDMWEYRIHKVPKLKKLKTKQSYLHAR
jgi:hypothetical protein